MPIYLHGLALQFYRGIGPDLQKLAPFKDFNFFIGANNSGKSTVLSFIHRFVHTSNKPNKIEPFEEYRGAVTGTTQMAFGIPLQQFIANSLKAIPNQQVAGQFNKEIKKLSGRLAENDMVWIKSSISAERRYEYSVIDLISNIRREFDDQTWNQMWGRLKNMQGWPDGFFVPA